MPTTARGLAAVMVGALAIACTSLPDIPRGTCGNHVLEAGEDCDTGQSGAGADGTVCRASGTAGACRFGCGPDNANAPCPAGWACGGDGICRVAKGQYQPIASLPSDAVSLGSGDYDGDGLADVRESTQTATRLRFGSTTGDFTGSFRVPTGDPFPATGDLSGDGIADLAFSLDGEVAVWTGSRARTLQPTQYPTLPIAPGTDVAFLPADALVNHPGDELVLFVQDAIILRDQTNIAQSDDAKGNFVLAAVLGKKPADLASRPIAARFDESASSPCDEVIFAFSGESEVHVLPTCAGDKANHPITKAHPDGRVLPSISLGSAVIGTGFHVVDLNGDGHLDLLIDAPLAGERNVVRALGNGDGTFDAPDTVTGYYGQFPMAVGQLTRGDFLPDFVDPTGKIVLKTRGPNLDAGAPIDAGSDDGGAEAGVPEAGPGAIVTTNVQAPTNVTWNEAIIADVNQNGLPDVLCGARGEIDFYNGTGSALLDHIPYFIDGAASGFSLGDFDGDLAIDVAYREHSTTSTSDALKVLFGNVLALPSAPVSLGSPGPIASISAAVLGDTTLGKADGLADIGLLLKSTDASQEEFISILLGSPDRQLQAPFGLSRARPNATPTDPPFIQAAGAALAIGNFTVDPVPPHPDIGLAAIDTNPDPGNPGASRDLRMWLLPTVGAAQLDPSEVTASAQAVETLSVSSTPSPTGLNWASAQSVAVDLDPTPNGALDEIVTLVPPQIESGAQGALFFARVSGGSFTVAASARIPVGVDPAGLTGPNAAWRLSAADVDADGAMDVLVFANTSQGPRAMVYFNKRSGAIDPAAAITLPVPSGASALAAAALNADADPQREIALLTDKGIFLADLANGAFTLSAQALPGVPAKGAVAITSADFSGDGIDDLAVAGGGQVQIVLGLPVNK